MIGLLRKIKKKLKPKGKISFAQGGEDMILNTLFAGQKSGQYIDIGANSPYNQSNTAFFYRKGWTGYNIDANPESIDVLKKARRKDKNIAAFISDERIEVDYNYYEKSLFNGANNPELIPSRLIKTEKIRSLTFEDLVKEYNIGGEIDFISIDVEGVDFKVLKSIDLQKIKPKVIIIESFDYLVESNLKNEVSQYLSKQNYRFIAKTVTNSIYVSDKFYLNRFEK